MSISSIASYAHAFGMGSHSPFQVRSGSSPVAGMLQQVQSNAQQLENDGEDAQDAFTNAIQQMSQHLNPTLPGSSSGTTASGTGATSTTSANASNPTAATSSSQAQTVHRHHHHFAGGDDGDDSGQAPTSISGTAGSSDSILGPMMSAMSQLMQNRGSNASVGSFLSGSAVGAPSNSALTALTQTQSAGSELSSILGSFLGSGSSTASSTASASGSNGTQSIQQLMNLIQSSSSSSSSAGGIFGAWAQGMNQSVLSSLV